jgi:6-phosphogluconolactonase/glucosamine-6-phosphate isomerase/deaminase
MFGDAVTEVVLADEDVPWGEVQLLQVDERMAPREHPDRNPTHLRENLLDNLPEPRGSFDPMPVDGLGLASVASDHARVLEAVAYS